MSRSGAVFALAVLGAALALPGGAGGELPSARGWLGVFVEDVDGGIELVGVMPGGPAERHGLRRGDLLVRAEETDLAGLPDLEAVLERHAPGERLHLAVVRGGRTLEFEVRLGTVRWVPPLPPAPPPPPPVPPEPEPEFGWVLADLTPDLRAYFGGPEEVGVLVASVPKGCAAEAAGLRVGDLVVALGGHEIREVADVERAVAPQIVRGDDVVASVVRAGDVRVVTLALDRAPEAPRPPAPEAAPAPRGTDPAARERAIRNEIQRLEQRIAELRRHLAEFERAAP